MNGPLLLALHVVAYSSFPVAVALLPFRSRLRILYAYLAAVLAFGGWLGQVYSIELADGVFLSGGTIAYGALLFTGLVITLLGREVHVIRSIIGVVVVINLFKVLLFWLVSESLRNAAVTNGLGIPRELFLQSIPLVVTGGILIIAEVLLLVSGFSRVLRAELWRPLEISLLVAMFVAVLAADGFLFPLLSYPFEPVLLDFARSAIWRNCLLGLAFGTPLIVFVVVFRARIEEFAQQPPALRELLMRTPTELLGELVRQRHDLEQLGTEHRSVSVELLESQQQLRSASRLSRVGWWGVDVPSGAVTLSTELWEILGYSESRSVTLQQSLRMYTPESRSRVESAIEACIRDGSPFTLSASIRTESRQAMQLQLIGEAVHDESGQVVRVIGAFQDVTELHDSLQRERKMADRLGTTLELLGDGFMLLDREWRVTFVNSGAERLLQCRSDTVVGTGVIEAFPADAGQSLADRMTSAVESGESTTIEVFAEEFGLWLEMRAHPLDDGLALFIRDNSEARRLEQQLQRAQRLESVGQLTGGIAHDFNNLLQVVIGSAEMVSPMLSDRPDERDLVELGRSAAMRGADLTKRLLAFSRRQTLDVELADVDELVDGIKSLLHHSLDANIDITVARTRDLWPVLIDAAQFEAAILNLALNARDAMPDGGQLRIESSNVELDTPVGALGRGCYVAVTVTDSGTGMSEEVLGRIFDPFFTTKETGKGSGLGLSMAYGFLQQSNGGIEVDSELGVGTVVTMYLPRADAFDEAAIAKSTRDQDQAGGDERILLVEDDELVRVQTNAMLESFGYRVTAVGDARQAMAVLEGSEPIDLLFTDIVLPGGINGHQLVEMAQRLRPDLPVVQASGIDSTRVDSSSGAMFDTGEGARREQSVLLKKPYRSADLRRAISSALGR